MDGVLNKYSKQNFKYTVMTWKGMSKLLSGINWGLLLCQNRYNNTSVPHGQSYLVSSVRYDEHNSSETKTSFFDICLLTYVSVVDSFFLSSFNAFNIQLSKYMPHTHIHTHAIQQSLSHLNEYWIDDVFECVLFSVKFPH